MAILQAREGPTTKKTITDKHETVDKKVKNVEGTEKKTTEQEQAA
jgi:uncharacterized protein YdcH (DUF465 family)